MFASRRVAWRTRSFCKRRGLMARGVCGGPGAMTSVGGGSCSPAWHRSRCISFSWCRDVLRAVTRPRGMGGCCLLSYGSRGRWEGLRHAWLVALLTGRTSFSTRGFGGMWTTSHLMGLLLHPSALASIALLRRAGDTRHTRRPHVPHSRIWAREDGGWVRGPRRRRASFCRLARGRGRRATPGQAGRLSLVSNRSRYRRHGPAPAQYGRPLSPLFPSDACSGLGPEEERRGGAVECGRCACAMSDALPCTKGAEVSSSSFLPDLCRGIARARQDQRCPYPHRSLRANPMQMWR
ncbi:hypothetical protein FB451DRAFT_117510 [Mycena latifolia]|nr:hypothetical protein FB451DRAFT_117510 [Mycena latifolia]